MIALYYIPLHRPFEKKNCARPLLGYYQNVCGGEVSVGVTFMSVSKFKYFVI